MSPGALERRVTLHGRYATAVCGSEPGDEPSPNPKGNATTRKLMYLYSSSAEPPQETTGFNPSSHGILELREIADNGQAISSAPLQAFAIAVDFTREPETDPELGGMDAQFSRNRSLDPLTPVLTELAAVVAEVAVDRAKGNASELLRESLTSTICALGYADEQSANLDTSNHDGHEHRKVFDGVCKALSAVRIEEISSSAAILGKALASDLTHYAFRALRENASGVHELEKLIGSLEDLTQGLISGDAPGTERDVQMILLNLGRIPVADSRESGGILSRLADTSGDEDSVWRCGVGIGFAVVRDCLRQQDRCSPETLQAALDRELDEPRSGQCASEAALLRMTWPDLGPLLARSIDVLRPPPGATANTTAKLAANILFEVAKKRMSPDQLVLVTEAQKIVNSVFDRDYLSASVAAAGVLVSKLDALCGSDQNCSSLPLTNSQARTGIAVLNGFISYASTYRAPSHSNETEKTDAERERLRHGERKKAMESLIDSATDRSNRRGKHILSFGVGVGFGMNVRYARGAGLRPYPDTEKVLFVPQLSLPTGLAYDYFEPNASHGYHIQAAIFDVGQYLAIDSSTGNFARPTPGTFVSPSLQLAFLLASPRTPVVVGIQGGYSPGFKADDFTPPCGQGEVCLGPIERQPGSAFLGGFIGTYIPFIDFN